jgi:hypothetical protein
MKRIVGCRYVPGFNGSPAWMDLDEAEKLLKKDTEYVNRMIDIMEEMGDIESAHHWVQCYPRIEHIK